MENNFLIGQPVIRIGPEKDYTTGRKGLVVEVNHDRVRVRWVYEKDGKYVLTSNATPGNGVRTWVNKKFVQSIKSLT